MRVMETAGSSRSRVAHVLSAAYGSGLLSPDTFNYRLDAALRAPLVSPPELIGDLQVRPSRPRMPKLCRRLWRALGSRWASFEHLPLLALDWSGETTALLIGRQSVCDVVLLDPNVSRQHARLRWRDGGWILQDLQSTNGTFINGRRVGRSELRPGDLLMLGATQVKVD